MQHNVIWTAPNKRHSRHKVDPSWTLFFQGLSAGTILYVVVFEVLQREKTKRKVPGLVQLVLIVVGFILMIAVEVTRKFHIFYSVTRRDFSKRKKNTDQ